MCGIREYRTGSSEQLITCAHQANVVSETSCRRHIGTVGREQKQERRRQDKTKKRILCSKNSTMLVICAILLVLPKAEAIKFSAEGVSVP